MIFRITTWRQILLYSGLVTALAVCVPLAVVTFVTWGLPWRALLGVLLVAGLIPLFIALPISIFAFYIVKILARTIAALDAHVKFDALTGLLTRSYFMTSVEAQRRDGGYLLMLDADHFKRINDEFGHEHGDYALKHISRIIQQTTGPAGLAGRLGGEEFAIYLPAVDERQACLLATGLGAALRASPLSVAGLDIVVTVSIGIARDTPDQDFRAALQQADLSLYAAKHAGRDRFELARTQRAAAPRKAALG